MRSIVPVLVLVASSALAQDLTKDPVHVAAEVLAKDHVYLLGKGVEGGMARDEAGRDILRKADFTVTQTLDATVLSASGEQLEGQEGFAAMAVESKNSSEVYLVFRGTDDRAGDMTDYLSTGGVEVGKKQYAAFKKQLDDLANRYRSSGKRIIVTGHSLGGALAQRFAADHPEMVSDLVLFQSPGVEESVWKKAEEARKAGRHVPRATLYVAAWDPIADRGYRHALDPTVVIAEFEGGERKKGFKEHSGFVLQSEKAASPWGAKQRYSTWGKVKGYRTVSYAEYAKQRGFRGDLTGLADEGDQHARYRSGGYDMVANGFSIGVTLVFNGTSFTGKDNAGQAITNGTLKGKSISFTRACPGFTPPYQDFVGSIEGGIAKGTFTGAGGAPGEKFKWEMQLEVAK